MLAFGNIAEVGGGTGGRAVLGLLQSNVNIDLLTDILDVIKVLIADTVLLVGSKVDIQRIFFGKNGGKHG